jgi:hypothetical protein
MPTPATESVLAEISRTTEAIVGRDDLVSRLSSGRPLRIKYGVDCTALDLHIGHAVNLWMMRRLQDLGHVVMFLLGDLTTLTSPDDDSTPLHVVRFAMHPTQGAQIPDPSSPTDPATTTESRAVPIRAFERMAPPWAGLAVSTLIPRAIRPSIATNHSAVGL